MTVKKVPDGAAFLIAFVFLKHLKARITNLKTILFENFLPMSPLK